MNKNKLKIHKILMKKKREVMIVNQKKMMKRIIRAIKSLKRIKGEL